MALDRGDIEFIEKINERLEKRLIDTIKGSATGVRAKIESEVNRIDEMDKIRNGKIEKNSCDIISLESETRTMRWVERNKKLTAIILIVGMVGVAVGYHEINFKRTIAKVLKLELKESGEQETSIE